MNGPKLSGCHEEHSREHLLQRQGAHSASGRRLCCLERLWIFWAKVSACRKQRWNWDTQAQARSWRHFRRGLEFRPVNSSSPRKTDRRLEADARLFNGKPGVWHTRGTDQAATLRRLNASKAAPNRSRPNETTVEASGTAGAPPGMAGAPLNSRMPVLGRYH